MNLSLVSRAIIGILLLQPLQLAWGDSAEEDHTVLTEYYRLLNLANDGQNDDKLALFTYTAEHGDELGNYSGVALAHLAEASTNGSGQASFWIGHMAEKGIWIDQDNQAAMIYYVLSAQQGFDKGMYRSVRLFSASARSATTEEEKESALANAQKWYDALASIQDTSADLFKSARFNYAMARLDGNSSDDLGLTLLGEAALDGHGEAVSFVRRTYSSALSEFSDVEDAALFAERLQPIIDVIGTDE